MLEEPTHGMRWCLNWYSHLMRTRGFLLCGITMFPTSLCPGEVLCVAKGQEVASHHFPEAVNGT